MKIVLTCLFTLIISCLFAQQKSTAIKRDTINIHGFIYDNDGKPLKLAHVQSAQLETEHNYFKAGTYTDASGYFYLKGAQTNDTLTVGPDIRYDIPAYYNKGSRYVVIYLPPVKVNDINSGKPIEIVQKRRIARSISSFTILPFSDAGNTTASTSSAQYPGGIGELENFIKQNLTYPERAIKSNLEGTVEIEFTINDQGKVTNDKILKGINPDIDDEVIRVLKKAPYWKPAINADRPVPSLQRISVLFKLTD
jgi:TonB family protein